MAELSIVTGSYNRFDQLRACVASIERYVARPFEIIVADAGSTDGTREWAATHPHIILIGERSLNGAVDAYNKAFSLARSPFVAHLNDDCELLDDCFDVACDMLQADGSIGQVAIPFKENGASPVINYINMGGQKVLYANFGVTRRTVGDAVGWWGDYLYTYGGDCELSFRIWEAGKRVVPLSGYYIRHRREQDGLRHIEDRARRFFFHRWAGFRLPEKVTP